MDIFKSILGDLDIFIAASNDHLMLVFKYTNILITLN